MAPLYFFWQALSPLKFACTDNVGAIAFTLHIAYLEANAIEEIT
jgi:hypothetical protein